MPLTATLPCSVASEELPSADDATVAVFPLPLNSMELSLVWDSAPGYPVLCDMEIILNGRIDRDAAEKGLLVALAHNPLFRSIIEVGPRGQLQWVLSNKPIFLDWAPLGVPVADQYNQPADLFRRPSLRVYVREGSCESRVLFQFHHSVSDGIGGFHFIEDFLVGYAREFPEGQSLKVRDIDISRLKRRNLTTDGGCLIRGVADWFNSLRYNLSFLFRCPQSLAVPKQSSGPYPVYRHLVGTLSGSVMARLRQVARDSGVSVNDLLLRDLFIATRKWNEQHQSTKSNGRIQIVMPQNLRSRDDRALPATNAMAFSFIARPESETHNPDELLNWIKTETETIRRGQLSRYYLAMMDYGYHLRLLKTFLKMGNCFGTVILSNLSDPTRRFVTKFPRSDRGLVIGNLTFGGIEAVSHVRRQTNASFVVINRDETLTVCARIDHNLFSIEQGHRILDNFLAQLEETANVIRSHGARTADTAIASRTESAVA